MRLTWETVVIVVTAVIGVVVLAAIGRDVAAYLGLASTIISAVLLGNVGQIKQNVNGNLSRLLDELSASRRSMADIAKTTIPVEALTTDSTSPTPVDTE